MFFGYFFLYKFYFNTKFELDRQRRYWEHENPVRHSLIDVSVLIWIGINSPLLITAILNLQQVVWPCFNLFYILQFLSKGHNSLQKKVKGRKKDIDVLLLASECFKGGEINTKKEVEHKKTGTVNDDYWPANPKAHCEGCLISNISAIFLSRIIYFIHSKFR